MEHPRGGDGEIEIDQITLATGERTLWDTLHPEPCTVASSIADLYVLDQY
jgi:hypothetical protein